MWFVSKQGPSSLAGDLLKIDSQGQGAKQFRIGDLYYTHTDPRNLRAIFKLANDMKFNDDLRIKFLLASGLFGEQAASQTILDPSDGFKEVTLTASEKQQIETKRNELLGGYKAKVGLDIGGEGRYYELGVLNLNLGNKQTGYGTSPIPSTDVPEGMIPSLVPGNAFNLLPRLPAQSVDAVYCEMTLSGFPQGQLKDILKVLKPGGVLNFYYSAGAIGVFEKAKKLNPSAITLDPKELPNLIEKMPDGKPFVLEMPLPRSRRDYNFSRIVIQFPQPYKGN